MFTTRAGALHRYVLVAEHACYLLSMLKGALPWSDPQDMAHLPGLGIQGMILGSAGKQGLFTQLDRVTLLLNNVRQVLPFHRLRRLTKGAPCSASASSRPKKDSSVEMRLPPCT